MDFGNWKLYIFWKLSNYKYLSFKTWRIKGKFFQKQKLMAKIYVSCNPAIFPICPLARAFLTFPTKTNLRPFLFGIQKDHNKKRYLWMNGHCFLRKRTSSSFKLFMFVLYEPRALIHQAFSALCIDSDLNKSRFV